MGVDDGRRRNRLEEFELDEYFVSAARYTEPSADARREQSACSAGGFRPAGRRGRADTGGVLIRPAPRSRPWLVFGGLLIAAVLMSLADPAIKLRAAWTLRDPMQLITADRTRPTPQRPPSSAPLGTPQLPSAGGGSHTFAALQPGSSVPVAYDPCRPLPYVVNNRTAPAGGDLLVHAAIGRIQEVTGLQFVFQGATQEPPGLEREPFQPHRYGDRWAPILIAWSDPAEVSALEADVAGIGGSTLVGTPAGPDVYVTGIVHLDGPQLAALMSQRGRAAAQAVILHELAHVVGLDHVTDPTQLMHPQSRHTDLQPGDIAGLSRLGTGPCIPVL